MASGPRSNGIIHKTFLEGKNSNLNLWIYLFNRKIQENEQLKTNINEIVSTKAQGPYDDAVSFRTFATDHPEDITFDLKNNVIGNDEVSLASSNSLEEEQQIENFDEDFEIINEISESKEEENMLNVKSLVATTPGGLFSRNNILKVKFDEFSERNPDIMQPKTENKKMKMDNLQKKIFNDTKQKKIELFFKKT